MFQSGQVVEWWWAESPDATVVGNVVEDKGGDTVTCQPFYGIDGERTWEVPRRRITPCE
jgi:hypothetical protein